MRNRPHVNRRRGMLRAAAAVAGLIVLLFIGLLVVSSLSAPKAKAPVVPPPPVVPTVKSGATVRPATVSPRQTTTPASPRPSVTATHKGKKKVLGLGPAVSGSDLALGPGSTSLSYSLAAGSGARSRHATSEAGRGATSPEWNLEVGTGHSLLREAMGSRQSIIPPNAAATRSSDGTTVAYFTPGSNPYRGSGLFVRVDGRQAIQVGRGDPLVRPILSTHGRLLGYVRATPSHAFPGTRWSVVQLDRQTGRTSVLASWNAMNVSPLGWVGGSLLTLVANATNTTLYALKPAYRERADALMGQPIVTAFLSPDGRSMAFAAPTNCVYCTVDLYDLADQRVWDGPSGVNNETALAWTRDGRQVVALAGHRLITLDPTSEQVGSAPAPNNLPRVWIHAMSASITRGHVTLTDTITGARYQAST